MLKHRTLIRRLRRDAPPESRDIIVRWIDDWDDDGPARPAVPRKDTPIEKKPEEDRGNAD